jgi:hypothetical protein
MIVSTDEALRLVPHLPPGSSQLILVTGRKGYGKTVFVAGNPDGTSPHGYIEEREPRVLILDIHDDYDRVMRRSNFQDAIADFKATDGPCRRRVVPPMDDGQNCTTFGDEFFPAIVKSKAENFLLVIEEASAFCRSTNIKGTSLETLILQGRHWGIRILAVAQRLNRIPGEFHSEATSILAYNTKRPRDCIILEEWGFDDAREVAPTLSIGHCYLIES